MSLIQIVILAVIQGLAELLPVSSSAHVIVAAKLMKLAGGRAGVHAAAGHAAHRHDVRGHRLLLARVAARVLLVARGVHAVRAVRHHRHGRDGHPGAGAESSASSASSAIGIRGSRRPRSSSFSTTSNSSPAGLAAVGVLILWSGLRAKIRPASEEITDRDSLAIGAIQGLCLPFRGFSRSGATISLGLLLGMAKTRTEEFSFALAVVLTPAVVGVGSAAADPPSRRGRRPAHRPARLPAEPGRNGFQLRRRSRRAAAALAAARTRPVVGLRSLLPRRRRRPYSPCIGPGLLNAECRMPIAE